MESKEEESKEEVVWYERLGVMIDERRGKKGEEKNREY